MNNHTVRDYYDKLGHRYHTERIANGKLFNEFIEMPAVLELLNGARSGKVLDIGCGSGIYSKFLAERGFDVTAIDISGQMLALAKELCKGYKINFLHSSFEDFDSEGKFDLILGSFMLGYFSDLEYFFKKTQSLLAEGGRAIVSSIHPIRMSAKNRSFDGYVIEDYFNSNTYKTILVEGEEGLEIWKHNFEDISKSAFVNNLVIERIIEPKPINQTFNSAKVDFFMKCPSILIVQLTSK